MNEGHAGFLGAERIRELVTDAGLDYDTALTVVRSSTVFTTHTPVPAGIDRFPVEMVQRYFDDEGSRVTTLLPGVPTQRILALGAEDDPTKFNMAHMGLRLAQRANGVSLLHGEVSRAMFNELWPGFDPEEVPIGSITNGVHARTWAARSGCSWVGSWPDRTHSASRRCGCGCSRSTPGICGGSGPSCASCWSRTSGPGSASRGWSGAHPKPN